MKMLSVLFSLVFVGSALAQSGTAGNPNFDRANDWRSGMPNVLTIDSQDVAFDGGSVEVPFTLNGGPAEVHLAVYSRDANPQYDGAAFGEGGVGNAMLRAAGLDTLISISGGQTFSEGANSITWDGRDFNGNEVGAGTYTYYLFALDNISNPTWIGPGSFRISYWMTNRVDFNVDPPVVWTLTKGRSGKSAAANSASTTSKIPKRMKLPDPLDERAPRPRNSVLGRQFLPARPSRPQRRLYHQQRPV